MRPLILAAFVVSTMMVLAARPAAAQSDTARREPEQSELNAALSARVAVIARGGGDSIVLRWAVTKPAVWVAANRVGFVVERAEAPTAGSRPADARFKRLAGPVMPWTKEQWVRFDESRPEPADTTMPDYVTVAAALLDGEQAAGSESEIPADDLAAIEERRSRFAMRFGLAMLAADRDADAAQGLGVRFVDRDIVAGKRYVYRVYLAAPTPPYRADTGYVEVSATAPKPAKRTGALRAGGNDGSITINWNAMPEYSAFTVERSSDNGRTFRRITRLPIVTARPDGVGDSLPEAYVDTLVRNYTPYLYRVYGATAFADMELIGEIRAMGRDRTPPGRPHVPNPEPTAGRAVTVTWEMAEPVAGDLAGFIVLRDSIADGTFTPLTPKLLPPSARSFDDATYSTVAPNYYTVAAFDTAGNFVMSQPALVTLIDSVAPSVPAWVRGTMDSNGVVTLVLKRNRERDCMGYRILRANADDHEFSSIIESYGSDDRPAAADTVLHDTVQVESLTKFVYYRATALDQHFNESELSTILAVPRPDRIPPVAPVIVDVGADDSSATVQFVPSTSDDVLRHTVYRRRAGETRWDSVASLGRDARAFVDRAVKQNQTLEYTLDAVDSAGLRSEFASPVSARPYDPGMRAGVIGFSGRYDSAENKVALSWRYAGLNEEYRYILYRALPGKLLRQFATIESAARAFADTRLQGDGVYEYVIKVVTRSGAESMPSEAVRVQVGGER